MHVLKAKGAQPAFQRVTTQVTPNHLAFRARGVEEFLPAVQHAVVVDDQAVARLHQHLHNVLRPVHHRSKLVPAAAQHRRPNRR